jgi:hypothetical protein
VFVWIGGHACQVAPRPSQAFDEAGSDPVASAEEDDGDRPGQIPYGHGTCRSPHDEAIWLEPNEFGGGTRKAIGLSVRVAAIYHEVLPFNVAKSSDGFVKGGVDGVVGLGRGEISNAIHP